MHALRRVRRSLVRGGVMLDLQPVLANAPVMSGKDVLGRLDESDFRALADRINAALEETIRAGVFVQEDEVTLDVVHRFGEADELVREVSNWTGTKIPRSLLQRLERSSPPFEVHEGARLRRLRVP